MKPSTDERLDAIDAKLAQLLDQRRAGRRRAGKRSTTVARQAQARVVHQPTDLDVAMAKRIQRRWASR